MNRANNGAKYGVDQYRFAHNYDLNGKSFDITADSKKYTLSFTSRDMLTFNSGKEAETLEYECLKIEADTYFVRFGLRIAVLELSLGLATFAFTESLVFGAIELPGRAAAEALHSLSDEMDGTSVRWTLGFEKYVTHEYLSADKCRAAWSPKGDQVADYHMKCVKIKNGIYLVEIIGAIPEGVCAPTGSDRVVFLEDYERMMLVGCIFGKVSPLMVSGYGEFPELN